MRVASLVPSSTEMLFALGLGDSVVAVTHECDYPPEAADRPHLTRSVLPAGLSAAEIDAEVRRVTAQGRALYELDEEVLASLEVDLIVTQALCAVCAVSFDDVRAVAERLPSRPDVVSLDPTTLGEVLDDVTRLGAATGEVGGAASLRDELAGRLDAVRAVASASPDRPRVVALEWLEPPFVGGHWVPEMIEIAGGRDPLGAPGLKSRTAEWEEIARAAPEVIVVMPCGYHVEESERQAREHLERLASLGAERVIAVDAASSYSRPGPRLVEGTELLAHFLSPQRLGPPQGVSWAAIET